MDPLAEYDILNTNPNYLLTVRHKLTEKLYYVQVVPLDDARNFQTKLSYRISLNHPNLLQFKEPFQHNDVRLYVILEHCKYGTLKDFIRKECLDNDRQLQESFLCRVLYQIAFALKTLDNFMGVLSMETVFLDEDFNIKLYNFQNLNEETTGKVFQKQKELKMSQLGRIIFEMCTRKAFEKSSFESELQKLNYSESLKGLLTFMIKDNSGIKKNLKKILCDPTILLQSSQWDFNSTFLENRQGSIKSCSESSDLDLDERLKKLEIKDAALRIKETLLKDKERELATKERKLQIMERDLKEMQYKINRDSRKSLSSISSTHSSKNLHNYSEEEPSYVSCGDSEVFPTSSKLQVEKISKPKNFTRTMSERRIRFKTSPLKDRNFVKHNHEKKNFRRSRILECESTKRTFNRTSLIMEPCQFNNVGWNEETKKHAFEMLRVLNKENINVKHTVL
ncbi:hypothetical protein ABEB36_006379 [Hypothenemus hampei]|uniref:non-specific serine/threonine protein kinase n=1 Tax=Hypothenemus hampei TaxID=57062 RepID=A0ABD1ETB6_HYPHA